MVRTKEDESAINLLHDANITVTNQRLSILSYLLRLDGHPTAEEIYEDLKDQLPILSKATVYNTLQTLVKEDVLEELTIEKERARYQLKSEAHPHFYCTKCKTIKNLSIDLPEELKVKQVDEHSVNKVQCWFVGICKGCKK